MFRIDQVLNFSDALLEWDWKCSSTFQTRIRNIENNNSHKRQSSIKNKRPHKKGRRDDIDRRNSYNSLENKYVNENNDHNTNDAHSINNDIEKDDNFLMHTIHPTEDELISHGHHLSISQPSELSTSQPSEYEDDNGHGYYHGSSVTGSGPNFLEGSITTQQSLCSDPPSLALATGPTTGPTTSSLASEKINNSKGPLAPTRATGGWETPHPDEPNRECSRTHTNQLNAFCNMGNQFEKLIQQKRGELLNMALQPLNGLSSRNESRYQSKESCASSIIPYKKKLYHALSGEHLLLKARVERDRRSTGTSLRTSVADEESVWEYSEVEESVIDPPITRSGRNIQKSSKKTRSNASSDYSTENEATLGPMQRFGPCNTKKGMVTPPSTRSSRIGTISSSRKGALKSIDGGTELFRTYHLPSKEVFNMKRPPRPVSPNCESASSLIGGKGSSQKNSVCRSGKATPQEKKRRPPPIETNFQKLEDVKIQNNINHSNTSSNSLRTDDVGNNSEMRLLFTPDHQQNGQYILDDTDMLPGAWDDFGTPSVFTEMPSMVHSNTHSNTQSRVLSRRPSGGTPRGTIGLLNKNKGMELPNTSRGVLDADTLIQRISSLNIIH